MPTHPLASLGRAILDHVRSGATDDRPLWEAHFHPEFVSVEGSGESASGYDGVAAKQKGWMDAHTMHGFTADGPYLGSDCVVIGYTIDVEPKDGSWPRMTMREVGVYTVDGGKVIKEEFMYEPMG
ncbi:MAG: SnoaL-like domain-containing protein [Planctomycetota bacterium]